MKCIVERILIKDPMGMRNDPEVAAFISRISEALGSDGRIVLRLSGIPCENRVLVSGESEELCQRHVDALKGMLAEKGYLCSGEE